jgi:hypothetical protein
MVSADRAASAPRIAGDFQLATGRACRNLRDPKRPPTGYFV